MDTIQIWWTAQGWMAIHPMLPDETLPTAYTADAPEEMVIRELSRLNCGMRVEVRHCA